MLTCRVDYLQIDDSCCSNILKLTRNAIDKYSEFLRHIMFFLDASKAQYENPDDYRDIVDWLLCAMFEEFKEPCFLFYEDKGPQLKEILSKSEIKWLDRQLLLCVKTIKSLKIKE